jgi:hypothetical protein
MLEAQLDLQGDWAVRDEAARLTLAWILSRAVRRQLRGLLKTIPAKEYQRVATLSRKLQDILVSLQDTDDPPELLQLNYKGRTKWEAWARGSVKLQPRGPRYATDPNTLYELAAFYQLGLQRPKFGFSRGETPQRNFLEIMFRLAREGYQVELEKTGQTGPSSLRAPEEELLVQAGKKTRKITTSADLVSRKFAEYSSEKSRTEFVKGNN